MIQVNGTIRLSDTPDEDTVAAMVTMMQASRQEDGCLDYTLARDLSDPQVLVLFERWRDQAALDAHFHTPHIAVFQQVLAANPPVSREIRLYETDEGRAL